MKSPNEVGAEASCIGWAALSIVWAAYESSGVKLTFLLRRHVVVCLVVLTRVEACKCRSDSDQLLFPIEWARARRVLCEGCSTVGPTGSCGAGVTLRVRCESAQALRSRPEVPRARSTCFGSQQALSLSLSHSHSRSLSGVGWAVQQCTNGMLIQNGYAPTWNNLDLQV